MTEREIDRFIDKIEANPNQRIDRNRGGQYLKNLLFEFAQEVRDITLIEVRVEVNKMRKKE